MTTKRDPKFGEIWQKTDRRTGLTIERRVAGSNGELVGYLGNEGPKEISLKAWREWARGAWRAAVQRA